MSIRSHTSHAMMFTVAIVVSFFISLSSITTAQAQPDAHDVASHMTQSGWHGGGNGGHHGGHRGWR